MIHFFIIYAIIYRLIFHKTNNIQFIKILEEIYDGLKDKTIIIISHRNNTVKYCDSIYVMENGKVVDNGPFQKIMKKYNHLSEK